MGEGGLYGNLASEYEIETSSQRQRVRWGWLVRAVREDCLKARVRPLREKLHMIQK